MSTSRISFFKPLAKPLSKRKGFALVLALSLMGFMMLLVITLAAMVQMQMRLSNHALVEQKAKQAAKFAAYQALSRVQVALGPDRRITANAMMFDNQLAKGIDALEQNAYEKYDWWAKPMNISRSDVQELDSLVGQNRRWVGVWDSRLGYSPEKIKREQERAQYAQKTMDTAITWLVSGNMINDPDELAKSGENTSVNFLPYNVLEKGQYVRAVGKGSYSTDNGEIRRDQDVLVPLVTLEKDPNPVSGEIESDKRQTRIAWWVSDEGQKASINSVAPYEDIQRAKTADKYRLQSLPFYSGIHGLTLMNSDGRAGQKALIFEMDDNGDDDSSMGRIRRLDDIRDLDVFKAADIPTTVSASKAFFHSVTFGSKGLLVNVQQGGLKKDLTIGLTRKDFANEPEILPIQAQSTNGTKNMYFEMPVGVAGYDYKQTAYPLWSTTDATLLNYRRIPQDANRKLKGQGHIFGPQMYGHEDLDDYETVTAMTVLEKLYDDDYLWKDTGGPLWDQLRSYYNMRAPNDPSSSKLHARVQVDDRIGLKPVVKRFQVFYVPTFVRYNTSYSRRPTPDAASPYGSSNGGEAYGVRLHIIPMLVLWNPYDVKIGENSYYLIMLSSRTPMGASRDHNPLGWYRFAIGYESSGYFQCLRDLRTEFMPSLDVDFLKNTRSIDIGRGELDNWSFIKDKNSNPINDDVFRGLYVPFRYWGTWFEALNADSSNNTFMQFDLKDPNGKKNIAKTMMSTKTFFNQIGAYPLGYGSIADHRNIRKVQGMANVSDVSSSAWRGFVDESNIYPDLAEANRRALLQKGNQKGVWSARVAKLPLFLNNLPASVFHGKFDNPSSDTKLFVMQRSINLANPGSYLAKGSQMQTADSALMDVSLRFLVKDTKGIEPGKAKVYAMKRIVNYLGNGKGTTSNLYNGPNGDIEGTGRGTSPYEKQEAMLYGIDEGGQLGNGFFLDVPHPENEHFYKFNNKSWDSNEYKTPHILFDLGLVRSYSQYMRDSQGNFPPSSITQYMIDMDDGAGNNWNFLDSRNAFNGCFTLATRPNGTPIGYGLYIRPPTTMIDGKSRLIAGGSSMGSQFYNFSYRNGAYYKYLEVDMWLWNKEGMRMVDTNAGSFADQVRNTPKFFYARGMRTFLGEYMHSFPDPSAQASTNSNDNSLSGIHTGQVTRNYFLMGVVANSANSTTSTNPYDFKNFQNDMKNVWGGETVDNQSMNRNGSPSPQAVADEYVVADAETDETGKPKTARVSIEPLQERVAIVDKATGAISPLNEVARYRYFINWLGVNSARHSANSWKMYSGIFNDDIGDLAPAAHKSCYIVPSPTNYTYGATLHAAITSNRDSVPYGFVFALPYADNDIGSEPLFNRRPFVSGSVLATSFDYDMSTRALNQGMPQPIKDSYGKTLLAELGRTNKGLQAISQVYGTENDGISENNAGYNINNLKEGNKYMIIGLRQTTGTTTAPIHHILREKEIVSNPANLASAHMSFFSGRSQFELVSQQGLGSNKMHLTYGNANPEGLNVDFAIGNSLCPYRIVPERSYHIQWLDGVSQYESGATNMGSFTGIIYPYGTVDYNRETKSSRGGGDADWVEDRSAIYDMSWHLNNILWDDYFFSTLPYRKDESNWIEKDYVFPQNPRLKYYISPNSSMEETQFTPDNFGADVIKEYVENSAKFWVEGAFNVNSTDIDAWKAVLSTYYGTEVASYDGKSGSEANNEVPFHRWGAPFNSKAFTNNSSVDEEDKVFQGYRSLNLDEIEQLAAAIVEHVKDRGPFYSMSQFVNRLTGNYSAEERFTDSLTDEQRLSLVPKMEKFDDRKYLENELKNDDYTYRISHMQKGVLQSAIDSTEINSAFHKDNDLLIEVGNDSRSMAESFKQDTRYSSLRDPKNLWENWRGAVGPQAAGVPAYLMQQDILARLGSFLTVRSDTFKIRAYGEVRNPISGIIEAKAWCEMTIQRVPEYIDTSEEKQESWRMFDREFEIGNNSNAANPYSSEIGTDGIIKGELSDINKALGRRFKVVSFRWLNENEI